MTELDHLAATRLAYDTVAATYAESQRDALADRPLDRAMLAAFAELVPSGGVVADVGCGPGHVTAYLRALGLDAFGVDLSPQMVEVARHANPGVRFDTGSMTALDVPDAALTGIVARYSIIHLPPEQLPVAFAELHRVLVPGGVLHLVFQAGDELVHVRHGYGHDVSLHAYRRSPGLIADQLRAAGLEPFAQLVKEPDGAEQGQQAYLLARCS